MPRANTAEHIRLRESQARLKHWKRWGPYLAERSWSTVREDYSENGDAWTYFPHEHARSRTYRWTEDGILGLCDNHQYLCFALSMWNGRDSILKERLFGLTGPQGNHGEDVKEIYYYLDAVPTNSYLKGLYKYPQARFPYQELIDQNARRTRAAAEFEIQDTGIFKDGRYFDIFCEYAKQDVDDVLIRLTVVNRASTLESLVILPTLWFRNIWRWDKDYPPDKIPRITEASAAELMAAHPVLGRFRFTYEGTPELLFTENETNTERLWNWRGQNRFYKDAFHRYLIDGEQNAVNPARNGTKAATVYRFDLQSGEERVLYFRVYRDSQPALARDQWPNVFEARKREADEFYKCLAEGCTEAERAVQREAFAGLFWSKQFYHFVVETWLNGDSASPPPPPERRHGRNHKWRHLFNEDVISMPDKWEYPWYAAWDLAFHMVAIAPADPDFAKEQLNLFLREWYMHPNGQIPAYEWNFSDANPPVHAWASWRVFKIDQKVSGKSDMQFLERVFHKLLVNFTWWVNRKDSEESNVFEGGFLGLDNIGVFDRNTTLPGGWLLEQSDGTSWMAMYCLMMLKMALSLADEDPAYEDIASKFFEHFLYIADAINHFEGTGLWNEEDGFYYDRLRQPSTGEGLQLRLRSMVGLVPLFAADTLESKTLQRFSGFPKSMNWFIQNRPDLTSGLASMTEMGIGERRLLSVVNRDRLVRITRRLFDECEFLSP
jgi:hypothetical protein